MADPWTEGGYAFKGGGKYLRKATQAKPCGTCGHFKSHHHGEGRTKDTYCEVWPMPGDWTTCTCKEYVEMVGTIEPASEP